MALEEYHNKRDFSSSSEPKGGSKKSTGTFRFVVQRHKARRLHYDLRLEMDGVLKSWAIPKGPSMNPADKRLSIQTEDHPIEYLSFEGVIPKGNYGAGEMKIWDRGTYTADALDNGSSLQNQLKEGNLKINLNGSKLKGRFALVKIAGSDQKDQWLLIKKKDAFAVDMDYNAEDLVEAVEESHPQKEVRAEQDIDLKKLIKPMLATEGDGVFNDDKWIYELKWDGYRVLANIDQGNVNLYSRNGISYNTKFDLITQQLKKISHRAILDGEMVTVDKEGRPQFQWLQNYSPESDGELRYYVFDILYLNGHSIIHLPLIDRKSLIPEVIDGLSNVVYCEHITGDGKAFYQQAIAAKLEGVIAKKADSTYTPGIRTSKWLKLKSTHSREALICGYTQGEEGRPFGSLILGIHEDDRLVYIGNCGTGFSDNTQRELLEILEPLQIENRPFEEKVNLKGRVPVWVKPEIICEVSFSEWTEVGSLRHPVFKGLRNDKMPTEIEIDKSDNQKDLASKTSNDALEIDGISVSISNLDKIYWPDDGLCKYDLIDYYLRISDTILPYLKDRPQNLSRHPDGITKEGFYQKDIGSILPDWIESIKIHSESADKEIDYMLCQNQAALLYMANLGCIEINPWNSKKGSLDNPDYTIIDIDPSEKSTFEEVIMVAQAAEEVLKKAGVEGYPKTSGSRGIHIYIPLGGKYTYQQGRDFTRIICHFIKELLPDLTTMERKIRERKGRIYLDYLQNRRGQTLAAPYCLRPQKGATASAPLLWSEVKKGLKKEDFNIHTMPKRIATMEDPFRKVLGEGIDIGKALERLSGEAESG